MKGKRFWIARDWDDMELVLHHTFEPRRGRSRWISAGRCHHFDPVLHEEEYGIHLDPGEKKRARIVTEETDD